MVSDTPSALRSATMNSIIVADRLAMEVAYCSSVTSCSTAWGAYTVAPAGLRASGTARDATSMAEPIASMSTDVIAMLTVSSTSVKPRRRRRSTVAVDGNPQSAIRNPQCRCPCGQVHRVATRCAVEGQGIRELVSVGGNREDHRLRGPGRPGVGLRLGQIARHTPHRQIALVAGGCAAVARPRNGGQDDDDHRTG